MSTANSSVPRARQRATLMCLSRTMRESTAVAMILDCWMRVKAEAEIRRSATNESRFMAKNINAGTAIGADESVRRFMIAPRLQLYEGAALAVIEVLAKSQSGCHAYQLPFCKQ